MSRNGDHFGPMKKRSGWLIPFAVFLVTAALSALILAYYILPTPPELVEEQAAPTESTNLVKLSVGAVAFHIPANFLPYASARRGGALDKVALIALLPNLEGYTLGAAPSFAANGPDSAVINLSIRPDPNALSEQNRFDRLYHLQVENPDGTPGAFGLMQYTFKASAGYPDEELFVGYTNNGIMVLRCSKPAPNMPAPTCLRDSQLGNGLSLSYYFKRAELEHWREIDANVRALVGALMDKV